MNQGIPANQQMCSQTRAGRPGQGERSGVRVIGEGPSANKVREGAVWMFGGEHSWQRQLHGQRTPYFPGKEAMLSASK